MTRLTIRQLMIFGAALVAIPLLVGNFLIWQGNLALKEALETKNNANVAMLSFKDVRYYVVNIQQFLTDAVATGDPTNGYRESAVNHKAALAELDKLAGLQPALKADLQVLKQQIDRLLNDGKAMVEVYIHKGQEAGNARMDEFDKTTDAIDDQLTRLSERLENTEKEARQLQDEIQHRGAMVSSLVAGLAILLVMLGSLYQYRQLKRMLGGEPAYASGIAEEIAKGNLALEVVNESAASNSLLGSIKSMAQQLAGHMRMLDQEAKQVRQSSYQISDISKQITNNTEQEQNHSDEVREATRVLEETAESVRSIAEKVNHHAEQARQSAQLGMQTMRSNIEEMGLAVGEAEQAERKIQELSEANQKIQIIIQTISSITEQTNLLALNAAIEAARAGEMGRGFAVVADEVRKLAHHAGQSTSEITGIIGNLNLLIEENTKSVQGIILRTRAGMDKAEEASTAISSLVEDIDKNVDAARQIGDASSTQTSRLNSLRDQLNTLLDSMAANSMKVHTTGVISQDLYRVTNNLQEIMDQFHFDSQWVTPPRPDESRRFPRVSKSLMVEVTEKNQPPRDAVTVDFSLSGMQLRMPIPLQGKKGDDVELRIQIPKESIEQYTNQEPLFIRARILWAKETEEGPTYGLTYVKPNSSQLQHLQQTFDFYCQKPTYQ